MVTKETAIRTFFPGVFGKQEWFPKELTPLWSDTSREALHSALNELMERQERAPLKREEREMVGVVLRALLSRKKIWPEGPFLFYRWMYLNNFRTCERYHQLWQELVLVEQAVWTNR